MITWQPAGRPGCRIMKYNIVLQKWNKKQSGARNSDSGPPSPPQKTLCFNVHFGGNYERITAQRGALFGQSSAPPQSATCNLHGGRACSAAKWPTLAFIYAFHCTFSQLPNKVPPAGCSEKCPTGIRFQGATTVSTILKVSKVFKCQILFVYWAINFYGADQYLN